MGLALTLLSTTGLLSFSWAALSSFSGRRYAYYCCELMYENELVSMEGLHFSEAKEGRGGCEDGTCEDGLGGDCNKDIKEINTLVKRY